MILGVTGCTGSGKSTLARIIAEQGWVLINVDLLGREVVESNPAVLGELAEVFGSDILDDTGALNRRLLAGRAFASSETTRQLNDIVHPVLIELLKSRIGEIKTTVTNVVVDCALIFEWKIEHLFDMVVNVHADDHLRKKRIMERDGRSDGEVAGIFAAQLSAYEKTRKADITISNNASIDRLSVYGILLSELPNYFDST